MATEYPFEINDFDVPSTYKSGLGSAKLILNIIFMMPGTYPTSPTMGVGLARYKFSILDSESISKLTNEITEQISQFLPELSDTEVAVSNAGDILLIGLDIKNTLFVFNVVNNGDSLKVKLNNINGGN